jgi:hypothetical protein
VRCSITRRSIRRDTFKPQSPSWSSRKWLGGRPGREAAAEQAYREEAAADDPDARRGLAGWLRECGRHAEADRIDECGLAAHGRTVEADPR